jgi:hypothetical protein
MDAAADGAALGLLQTVVIAIGAAAAGAAVFRVSGWTVRGVVLTICLAALAVDDLTGFHDRLRSFDASWLPGPSSSAKLEAGAAFAVLLALVFVLLWDDSRRARPETKTVLRSGLMVLVLAILIRAVAAYTDMDSSVQGSLRDWAIAVEQGVDLAGWALVTWALVDIARTPRPRLQVVP